MKGIFSRTSLLVGEAGLARLASARVLIAGVGGVGSYAAEALGRAGVESLTLIDSDVIHASNVNRQLHALTTTLGLPKVVVMAERLRTINPNLQVIPQQLLITPDNVAELLATKYDLVLDAIDTFSAKLALLQRCVAQQVTVISSMGAAGKLDPTRVTVADIGETQGCRLARKLRKQLRRQGIEQGITVVYSDEPCREGRFGEAEQDAADTRRALGSISFLPGTFGLCMAGEAVRRILQ